MTNYGDELDIAKLPKVDFKKGSNVKPKLIELRIGDTIYECTASVNDTHRTTIGSLKKEFSMAMAAKVQEMIRSYTTYKEQMDARMRDMAQTVPAFKLTREQLLAGYLQTKEGNNTVIYAPVKYNVKILSTRVDTPQGSTSRLYQLKHPIVDWPGYLGIYFVRDTSSEDDNTVNPMLIPTSLTLLDTQLNPMPYQFHNPGNLCIGDLGVKRAYINDGIEGLVDTAMEMLETINGESLAMRSNHNFNFDYVSKIKVHKWLTEVFGNQHRMHDIAYIETIAKPVAGEAITARAANTPAPRNASEVRGRGWSTDGVTDAAAATVEAEIAETEEEIEFEAFDEEQDDQR